MQGFTCNFLPRLQKLEVVHHHHSLHPPSTTTTAQYTRTHGLLQKCRCSHQTCIAQPTHAPAEGNAALDWC